MKRVLMLAALSGVAMTVQAAMNCSSSSGDKTVPVVELYTSEGCDSCPPADKWFSTLDPARSGVIPLAFHVDYWNYLGWQDPFAQAGFGERQRAGVRRQQGRVAYTPQVVLDGRDLRSWFRTAALDAGVAAAQGRKPGARIRIDATREGRRLQLNVSGAVEPESGAAKPVVFLAITESNLVSRVTSGENRGVTLRHDHVVRELIGPLQTAAQGRFALRQEIAMDARWKPEHLSIVAFVEDLATGTTLQAVALRPCGG